MDDGAKAIDDGSKHLRVPALFEVPQKRRDT
jgi:hypothetical protein